MERWKRRVKVRVDYIYIAICRDGNCSIICMETDGITHRAISSLMYILTKSEQEYYKTVLRLRFHTEMKEQKVKIDYAFNYCLFLTTLLTPYSAPLALPEAH